MTTAERLLTHVVGLAGEIGDRNVFRPGALEAAAEYIVKQWSSFGYRVNRQEYQVKHVTCANLEVERPGLEPTGGILLIGAHYDSVRGCPAANDNGSGSRRCSSWRAALPRSNRPARCASSRSPMRSRRSS